MERLNQAVRLPSRAMFNHRLMTACPEANFAPGTQAHPSQTREKSRQVDRHFRCCRSDTARRKLLTAIAPNARPAAFGVSFRPHSRLGAQKVVASARRDSQLGRVRVATDVMAGLVPAIHVCRGEACLAPTHTDVDARDKRGHDGERHSTLRPIGFGEYWPT
jgi:hypothetical protein